jgi:hypothetical protein
MVITTVSTNTGRVIAEITELCKKMDCTFEYSITKGLFKDTVKIKIDGGDFSKRYVALHIRSL